MTHLTKAEKDIIWDVMNSVRRENERRLWGDEPDGVKERLELDLKIIKGLIKKCKPNW